MKKQLFLALAVAALSFPFFAYAQDQGGGDSAQREFERNLDNAREVQERLDRERQAREQAQRDRERDVGHEGRLRVSEDVSLGGSIGEGGGEVNIRVDLPD